MHEKGGKEEEKTRVQKSDVQLEKEN